MPDLITHYLFGQEALKQLPKQKQIEAYRANYDLGCNGPDYFFYYRLLPWQKDKEKNLVHQYGNLLHNHSIQDYFTYMFTYLKNHQEDQGLYAYMVGYLMHYFLDRHAHPYIFYFSGVQDENQEHRIYKYYHKRFEVAVDERMLEQREHTNIKAFHPASIIRPQEMTMDSIYDFVSVVLKDVYQQTLTRQQFETCIYDFKRDLQLLYSKGKTKKKLMLWIEKTFHLDPLVSTAMYSIEVETIDYLNKEHRPWSDPCFKEKISNESFIDLYEKALKECVKFICRLDHYLEGEETLETLLGIIDGRCFDTNQKEDVKMYYSDCVYERGTYGSKRDI